MYLHLACQYLYFLRAAISHNLIDACTNRFVRSLKKGWFVLLRAVIYPIGKGQPANYGRGLGISFAAIDRFEVADSSTLESS